MWPRWWLGCSFLGLLGGKGRLYRHCRFERCVTDIHAGHGAPVWITRKVRQHGHTAHATLKVLSSKQPTSPAAVRPRFMHSRTAHPERPMLCLPSLLCCAVLQTGDNSLTISELPVRSWTQPYKEFLETLLKGADKDKDKDKGTAAARKKKAADDDGGGCEGGRERMLNTFCDGGGGGGGAGRRLGHRVGEGCEGRGVKGLCTQCWKQTTGRMGVLLSCHCYAGPSAPLHIMHTQPALHTAVQSSPCMVCSAPHVFAISSPF